MERGDPGIRWSGKVVPERTYEENLQRLADARWLDLTAQWLTRHGEVAPRPEGEGAVRPLLRGVRGLTSDGKPHWLQGLKAGLRKAW